MANILNQAPRFSRRTFLKGAGATLALPWLESMVPAAVRANPAAMTGVNAAGIPKRAVFCMWGMGVNGRDFTPSTFGRDYEMTKILKPLEAHKNDFTVISGMKLTHSGGHSGDRTFLTGTNTHDAGSDLRISCDQELAQMIGEDTRYKSLVLGIRNGTGFGNPQDHTLSWTKNGMPIPAENRPHVLFDRLFRPETAESIEQREESFAKRGSILDELKDEAKRFVKKLGQTDKEKMDEYLTAIRDVEAKMQEDREWLHEPKPEVEELEFGDQQSLDPGKRELDYRRYQRLMFDVITLALQTDSTRVISYMARMDLRDGTYSFKAEGNPYGYHEMTHHGEDPDKLKWLTQSDVWYMEEWNYFIEKLKSVKEGDSTLYDNTITVWSSTGGTINAHNNHNLPALVFGGTNHGVQHQGHLNQEDALLGNLWQSVFTTFGAPVPENFQGGEANGIVKDLIVT